MARSGRNARIAEVGDSVVTEREQIELLLSQPEVVAWLGLSPQQIVKWLEPGETWDDEDDATRSRWATGGA